MKRFLVLCCDCDPKKDCEGRGGRWKPYVGEVTCRHLGDAPCKPLYAGVCVYGEAERQ